MSKANRKAHRSNSPRKTALGSLGKEDVTGSSASGGLQNTSGIDWSKEIAQLKSGTYSSLEDACSALLAAVQQKIGLTHEERAFVAGTILCNEALRDLIRRELL